MRESGGELEWLLGEDLKCNCIVQCPFFRIIFRIFQHFAKKQFPVRVEKKN